MAQITAKMKEIGNMKNTGEHVNKVESELLLGFTKLYEELIMLNNSVTQMLPLDEVSTDKFNCYEPKSTVVKRFVLEMEKWIKEQKTIEEEEEIAPHDSVSVVARHNRKSKSKTGSSTNSSSVVSCTSSVARMKEEAKRSAFLAQAESLKRKKAIQL